MAYIYLLQSFGSEHAAGMCENVATVLGIKIRITVFILLFFFLRWRVLLRGRSLMSRHFLIDFISIDRLTPLLSQEDFP